jgi:diguanylate cyclase (GGDEF)-like protein
MRLELLKHGACCNIEKPLTEAEEACQLIINTVNGYSERQEALQIAADMRYTCEADRLNLLELELVKGLQHMIGETEEPTSIFKHAFSLIKNYLPFDVFAALVLRGSETEIYVYPRTTINSALAEAIPGTLIKKMAKLSEEETKVKVILHGKSPSVQAASQDLTSIVVPLTGTSRTYGYAGIYRAASFDYGEESVFKRFCGHITTAFEKIALFEEVKALSVRDGLTGLYNHSTIVAKLEQEVRRSTRYGSPLCILLFDVDDFKDVNDTHGHLAGDAVLAQIGGLLQGGIRSIDSVGRYGGEEFLAVLPETEPESAVAIGDRLRQRIGSYAFTFDDKKINLSVSCGVATHREGRDTGALIKLADQNLYTAKTDGKNMVHYDEK